MAKEMTSNAVSILPPTSGIKDGPTRGFLDALTNLLDARSGYTNKDAPERFITAAEFDGLANRALVQAFSSGGISPGSGSGTSVPSAKEVNDAIDNLADFIRKSLIYQKLGEQIDLIDISSLRERVRELGTGIFREETVREEEDLRLASLILTLQAGLDDAAAGITEELEVRVTRDLALAKAINTIWASVGGSEAVIQDGALSSATPNSAQATKWTQVQAALTDPNTGQVSSTSILQESRSYASNADGKFNSIYSVRAQVSTGGRTIVGGFGLSATNGAGSGSGPTIDFGVRADTFFIAATTETPDAATQINQGSAIPFMVLTRNQVVNGVTYTPGVYIKKAVIGDATIGSAQIADLAVTNAKIGETIQSNNYVQGSSGWIINKSGYAEFDMVRMRRREILATGYLDPISIGEAGMIRMIETYAVEYGKVTSVEKRIKTFVEVQLPPIPTGVTDSAIRDTYAYQPYGVGVWQEGYGALRNWVDGSPGTPDSISLAFSGDACPATTYSNSGSWTDSNMVHVSIRVTARAITGGGDFTIPPLRWVLYRM